MCVSLSMAFTHLHVHSHYSLLDGLPKIDELVRAAKKKGMKSIALTDHGAMHGLIEFYQQCQKEKIKPILGVETYVARRSRFDKEAREDTKPFHLILLAENNTGYKNLIKLITRAHLEGFYYKPRIDWDLLEEYHEGIISLSGCLASELAQTFLHQGEEKAKKIIHKYIKLFGVKNYFLEVQPIDLDEQRQYNEFLFRVSKELHVPVVATTDSHYLEPEDAEAQDILLCIQTKHKQSDTNRLSLLGQDLSLKTEKQMREAFPDNPEIIDVTDHIVARCNVTLTFGESLLPHFPLPAGITADAHLENLCQQALSERYPETHASPEIQQRLAFEIQTIKQTGFAPYFLIVYDFVAWAKKKGIVVGPGRGSAAGSIVSYLLNITNVDPIKYELLFERFLNPERISMPDIDLDFADTRRDEVIRYVEGKYGKDHVAQIITFGTMAARAAVRDVGRALGLPYSYCDRVAKLIPMFTSLADAIDTIPELREVMSDPEGKKLLEMAQKLEGVARHSSTHACGVVITKEPLDQYLPIQYASTNDQTIVSQYSLHPIEDLGLLKMDFLGLKNLTTIEQTLDIIKKARGEQIDIESMPLEDEFTFSLLQKGQTVGVFQLESSGMRRYLKELKPSSLEDIIAMVSLYRPGPIEFIPDFIAGKHGKKKITYIHPGLKPILQKTYGIVVYQEQVMRIARDLAGFTFGEADVLRKAVGKKIKSLLDEQRNKLIDGMSANGMERKTATAIWKFIEPFARYGFNRAHAACYAIIAYQTAFLKTHYPNEFMAALMTSDQHNIERIAIEVDEARQMEISVLPPDINESYTTFTAVFNTDQQPTQKIRFGLLAIKNVGENIVRTIVHERKQNGKYVSLADFLQRVHTKDLNKKSLESLVQSGALDAFEERNTLLQNMDSMLRFARNEQKEKESNQTNLFAALPTDLSQPTLTLTPAPPASQKTKLSWEKQLLGLYITEHPIERIQKKVNKKTVKISELLHNPALAKNKRVDILGVVSSTTHIMTKTLESMIFVKCEDQTGMIELIVFPKTLKIYPNIWEEGKILFITGRTSDKNGEDKFIVDSAKEIEDADNNIHIQLPQHITQENFKKLQGLCSNSFGDQRVFFLAHNGNGGKIIKTPYTATLTAELKNDIETLLGNGSVSTQ